MKSLRSDLEELLKELGLTEEFKLYRLRRDFKDLFTAPLTHHVYPAGLKKGVLTLIVDSSEWLFELKLNEQKIKNRLKNYNIKSIRFRLGRIPRKDKPVEHSQRQAPGIAALPEELKDEISEKIKDPELRELLEATIKKSLLRRK